MEKIKHLLIVGAGSAGRRHARNFRQLGCQISAVDPRQDRLEEACGEGTLAGTYTTLEAALDHEGWDGFVIATPPSMHVDQMLAIFQRHPSCKIFCEKPLSVTAAEATRVEPFRDQILLGYTYRWWPPLREMRNRMHRGDIGKVHTMRFVMSAHLADWHPWESYKDFFMAKREQGGGALLDESHFLDLMCWFLGAPSSLIAQVDHISDLEIDADDTADILVRYRGGARVNLHLDLMGRPHERSVRAMGQQGTLLYQYEDNSLWQSQEMSGLGEEKKFTCERNTMFEGAACSYLDWLKEGGTPPVCTWEDGRRALRLVDACRQSSDQGQKIDFGPDL